MSSMQIEKFIDGQDSALELAIKQDISKLKEHSAAIQKDLVGLRDDQDRDKIIGWLSITDPSLNHNAACKKHQPTTGEWLIRRGEFEKWKNMLNSHLWLCGNGKALSLTFYLTILA
jgi:ankyrin repeat domain-containing protein 50